MAKKQQRDRSPRTKDTGKRIKKKVCIFCAERIDWVDYKDVNLLRRFMSDRAKIRARRVTGNCTQHQAAVAIAIKTARELALLPYATRVATSRGGGGRGGRRRDDDGERGDRGDRGDRRPREDGDVPTPPVDTVGEVAAVADVVPAGAGEEA